MKTTTLLHLANSSMLLSFIAFIVSAVLAYGLENELPLLIVTILHVSQMFLAGFFKVSYVVRLVAQKQLGLVVR